MKRIGLLFLFILGFATLMLAQDSAMPAQHSNKKMEMSGTICRSSCVTVVDNLSTCDKSCTDKSGDAVLVDDQGQVQKIANQDMCMPHMGKHVKMMVTPTESERENTLRIMQLTEDSGGY